MGYATGTIFTRLDGIDLVSDSDAFSRSIGVPVKTTGPPLSNKGRKGRHVGTQHR
jgi:hypothetical protein